MGYIIRGMWVIVCTLLGRRGQRGFAGQGWPDVLGSMRVTIIGKQEFAAHVLADPDQG
jgi:hypothetical protein